ncbi:MAG: dockerin type I domain-containing protein, partial [Pirellula sp.]
EPVGELRWIDQCRRFEEAMYVDITGVYVAWVDWRNGNSEIYVAHHPGGVGDWRALVGFNGNNSASGGGISNDSNQSRRPTLFKTEDSDSLVVAWTSIASDGTSYIEVAREDTNWTRIANPGHTGAADNARFIQFADLSGLLFWIDASTGVKRLSVSQYIHAEGCFKGFTSARGVEGFPREEDVKDYDVAGVEFQAVVAMSYGSASDQDIVVRMNRVNLTDDSMLCPAVPNASVVEYVVDIWDTIQTISDGDTQNPAVGIQYIRQRGFVKGEIELEVDVAVAWEVATQRDNQVDGMVIHVPLDGPITTQPIIPEYRSDNGPRSSAETISDTLGYAAKPDIAMSHGGTFLGWMDDGVFLGDNLSSLFVLSRIRDTTPGSYVMREQAPQDASGRGISKTGGSLRELSLMADEDGFGGSQPYALWTEASTIMPAIANGISVNGENVYMRVTLEGLEAVDDFVLLRKFGQFKGNVLANDLNLFGEVDGYVSRFDGRVLTPGKKDSIAFTSPHGARVTVNTKGNITYNPRGASAFQSLRQGETLTESFIYRVTNGIHDAEAVVEFTIVGRNAWYNERNALDVNDDQFVSPLDVLNLINDINSKGARELDDIGPTLKQFLDVDDNGVISPLDVLSVINRINSTGAGEGERSEPSNLEARKSQPSLVYEYQISILGMLMDISSDSLDETLPVWKKPALRTRSNR